MHPARGGSPKRGGGEGPEGCRIWGVRGPFTVEKKGPFSMKTPWQFRAQNEERILNRRWANYGFFGEHGFNTRGHICRTKFARRFFRATKFPTKNAPKFSAERSLHESFCRAMKFPTKNAPKCLIRNFVGRNLHQKFPPNFSHNFPLRKN